MRPPGPFGKHPVPSPKLFTLIKLTVLSCSALLVACGADTVDKATPITKTRAELQSEIFIDSSHPNTGYSRLYALDNRLYATVPGEGVQVIDNSDPAKPKDIAFINLPGVEDVVIEGDTFVTNQYSDLVIFSISQQTEIGRVNNLYDYKDYIELPSNSYWAGTASVLQDHVVVGYELEEKDNENSCFIFCW